jgi:PhnB protein
VIEYLRETFGFEQRFAQLGAAGRMHSELVLGEDGLVMVGQAWDGFSSPKTLGVHPPSLIHVYVDDVEALHARAQSNGAEITELELSPAGDRRFTATDPEGQVWVFAQRVDTPPA